MLQEHNASLNDTTSWTSNYTSNSNDNMDASNYGARKTFGQLITLLSFIGLMALFGFIWCCVSCRRHFRRNHRNRSSEPRQIRSGELPRTNTHSSAATGTSARSNGSSLRGWMKIQRSTSSINRLPTPRSPTENMEVGSASSNRSPGTQIMGNRMPPSRHDPWTHPIQTPNIIWDPSSYPASNYITAPHHPNTSTSQVQSLYGVQDESSARIERINQARNRLSALRSRMEAARAIRQLSMNNTAPSNPDPTPVSTAAPPSDAPTSRPASSEQDQQRRGSDASASRRASFEGRPRTPPPAYGRTWDNTPYTESEEEADVEVETVPAYEATGRRSG